LLSGAVSDAEPRFSVKELVYRHGVKAATPRTPMERSSDGDVGSRG